MDCVGIIVAFERPLQRPAFLIDLGLARIHIIISGAYRYVLIPVVLNSRANANLPIQGQIRRAGILIGRRGVVGGANRSQPAVGKPVLGSQGEVPGVVVIQILGEFRRGR